MPSSMNPFAAPGTGRTPQTQEEVMGLPPKDLVAGCLILRDGTTYVGRITSISGGYRVELARGRLIIPYDHVRLTAADLDEAYEKQVDGLLTGSASERQDLARWCFENKLYSHARTECLAAIRMEPQRADLRQFLLKIDAALNQVNAATSPALIPPTLLTDDRRTAQGLTPKTNAEFIRRVQPLLMNTCGNAKCHGAASDQEFRLQPVFAGRGSQRAQSQYNLEQVLRQIDPEEPESSPLLSLPRDKKRSPVHTSVYAGAKGYEQYELLKSWVLQVVQENPAAAKGTALTESPRPLAPARTKPLLLEPRSQPIEAASAESSNPRHVTPAANWAETEPLDPAAPSAEISDEELLEGVRRAARPDPFDPDEFNRTVRPSRAE